ncbi:NCS1 family nucleobase:cation symporter-1 [Streptomyces sp. NPDC050095]|uniref:NCS1 family nucleobase:cation symporter-1 n=1 Tax=unclassified Streptomyces TaxID=2593676 RepID=UPI00344AAD80
MTSTVPPSRQVDSAQLTHADGRVSLVEGVALDDSRFANEDLRPVPVGRRTWTTCNYVALWIGMAHCIPSWTLASSLVALGMDWKQAVFTIALANVIVLVPMLLTGHAGPKYGIPFPVLVRASFGLRGANLPAMVRAAVACCWFGIQTWIGGQGIFVLLGKAFGGWATASEIGGYPWTLWLCFVTFWIFELAIIYRGMETLRRFENWAAPFVLVGAVVLLIWMTSKAGGLGPLLDQPSKLGWGSDFWPVFFPSLMAMIAFWSTLSLNIPDFTRFGAGQRAQIWGQSLGLPTTMTAFALMSVLVTSGSQAVYGGATIWDPVQLAAKTDNVFGLLFALITVLIATISVNLAANVVSPAYDLSNLAPKLINFRTGALITGVVGVLVMPWKLTATPELYIFTWLGMVGGLLGTVAGILIADYWIIRRTVLHLADLYSDQGRYWYSGGWNWRAVVAFAVGGTLAIGGSYSQPGKGPFPEDGLIPVLQPLADYSWAIGLGSSLLLYTVTSLGQRRGNSAA